MTPTTPTGTTSRTSPGTKRNSARSAVEPSEREFQKSVVELAERLGWLVFHVADSRKIVRRGDRMISVPDPEAAGFPDLVCCHPGRSRLIFAELKTRTGRVRPKQTEWLNGLAAAGETVFVWRPEHMEAIRQELQR